MTPEQINQRIAEKCGATEPSSIMGWWPLCQFEMLYKLGCRPIKSEERIGMVLADIPNYFSDLNACHEMEGALTTDAEKDAYVRYLYCMGDFSMPFETTPLFREFEITNSIAPQRCQAFLRAVGGWEE